MSTLIIIPAYNEEECIYQTVLELLEKAPEFDYVIVNDGSSDKTADICRSHGFNLIDLPVNLGLSGAFQTGMKYAYRHGYDHAMQFDADGQHVPLYISDLVDTMDDSGADVVIGSRFVTESKPRSLRMLGSNLISAFIHLTTGAVIKDQHPVCASTTAPRSPNSQREPTYLQNPTPWHFSSSVIKPWYLSIRSPCVRGRAEKAISLFPSQLVIWQTPALPFSFHSGLGGKHESSA